MSQVYTKNTIFFPSSCLYNSIAIPVDPKSKIRGISQWNASVLPSDLVSYKQINSPYFSFKVEIVYGLTWFPNICFQGFLNLLCACL